MVPNTFEKEILPKNRIQVPIKVGNTSEDLLNGICLIIYSLYQSMDIKKKVHDKFN